MKSIRLSSVTKIGLIVIAHCIVSPAFGSSIQDAFESAKLIDPSLRSSKFNQNAAKENIVIARARLLPQISIQGSSNQLTQTTTQDVPGNASISRSFTGPSVNHQFVIRQGLFRPKDVAALNFAEFQSQFGDLKYQSELTELWMRVAIAWIDLVGAAQLVEVHEQPLKYLFAAAKQESAKLIQGDGTKDAVIEADAQYQLANSNYLQALQTLKAKQSIYEILTHTDSKSLLGLKLDLKPKPIFLEIDRDRHWARIRENSFELRFAELQELMQRERVRISSADHLPTLDVLAAWSVAKNDATSTQGYQYKNNQVGIQYVIPIYSGGSVSASDRQALLSLEASIAETQAVANRVESDFSLLWASWLGQGARVLAGQKLVDSAKEQLRATHLSYMQGVKTNVDVASAELSLSRRIADQINFVMEYQKYTIRLSRGDNKLDSIYISIQDYGVN
jgi:protease secretion system outer membrane protein